jgi:hypothetical protein
MAGICAFAVCSFGLFKVSVSLNGSVHVHRQGVLENNKI